MAKLFIAKEVCEVLEPRPPPAVLPHGYRFRSWWGLERTVYAQGGLEVRTVTDEHGEPWFVAKDVCDVLGYANGPKAVRDHCKHSETLKQNESFGLDIPPRGQGRVRDSGTRTSH